MLEINGLSKRYGDINAVSGVSFTVPRGRIVGFVGPNGAGKSTTMRSIFGLVAPDQGSISWDGQPVDASTLDRFGYMPEQRGLYPKMPIGRQVGFFAELKGLDGTTAREQAEGLLGDLGLGDRLNDPLEKLSHGNQQRVQLAVSLVSRPELLVLDEPFNGLDPVAVVTLQQVLAREIERGAGILFSSHQLDLVERLCDDVVMIVDGTIRAAGPVTEVRRSAGIRTVTVEIDQPTRSLSSVLVGAVDGRVTPHGPDKAVIEIADEAKLEQILGLARSAGSVIRFDYDLPSLEAVFTAIAEGSPVSAPTVPARPAQSDTPLNTGVVR
jgi:ABC-2 type transport system ATP-binding protein